jgi:uncharacterized protein (TIGR02117 family)
MKRSPVIVGWLGWVLVCGALLVSAGCLRARPDLYPPRPGEPSFEVVVVNNHWHTGLVLSRDMLSPQLRSLMPNESDAGFVEIGWGDDGFYRSEKVTSGLAIRAVFFSRGSVIHAVAVPTSPDTYYAGYDVRLHRLSVSRAGLDRLNTFLERAFKTCEAGRSVRLQKGLAERSSFYQAEGRYAGWHTCNHWTADAIRTTGFPITPMYAFFANNVGWQVDHATK